MMQVFQLKETLITQITRKVLYYKCKETLITQIAQKIIYKPAAITNYTDKLTRLCNLRNLRQLNPESLYYQRIPIAVQIINFNGRIGG